MCVQLCVAHIRFLVLACGASTTPPPCCRPPLVQEVRRRAAEEAAAAEAAAQHGNGAPPVDFAAMVTALLQGLAAPPMAPPNGAHGAQ